MARTKQHFRRRWSAMKPMNERSSNPGMARYVEQEGARNPILFPGSQREDEIAVLQACGLTQEAVHPLPMSDATGS